MAVMWLIQLGRAIPSFVMVAEYRKFLQDEGSVSKLLFLNLFAFAEQRLNIDSVNQG